MTARNASALQLMATYRAEQPQRLAWSVSGTLFVASTRSVDEVAPATGAGKRVLEVVAPDRILAVAPEGVAAVASGGGSAVRLVDLATGQVRRTLDAGGVVSSGVFAGTRLLLATGDRIAATLWDTGTGQRVGELSGFQTAAPVFSLALAGDGSRAAWVARGTLQFHEVATNSLGARLQFEDVIGAYAFAPDGRTFATATAVQSGGALQGRVQIWNPSAGLEVLRLTPQGLPATVAYAPTQPLLATGGEGFAVWSLADGTQVGGGDLLAAGRVRLVAFSADGVVLATVADDGLIRFWRGAP